jgi:Fe-S-cluster containining protein
MSPQDPKPPFECQQCGQCCAGRGGIYVTLLEIAQMASYLDMSNTDFCRRYLEDSPVGARLTTANGVCIFLKDHLCQVHPVKPRICRQWPFLPALLTHADELEYAKGACPGIDPQCRHEDFVALAKNGHRA